MSDLIGMAEQYMAWDPIPESAEEIRELLTKKRFDDLMQRLEQRCVFGTAGLRAPMGAGYDRINGLTVLQTTQGVATYVLEKFADAESRCVVIGYDHREYGELSSERLALIAAAVFVHYGIPVVLYNRVVCTPLVPFGVDLKHAVCGIMITASHNPSKDNGYKLYWENGVQIIPPLDSEIADSILSHLVPATNYCWKTIRSQCEDCTDEIVEAYMRKAASSLCRHPLQNKVVRRCLTPAQNYPLPIVYTAMHGVGSVFVRDMFEAFNHKQPMVVLEQDLPNAQFPTVEFPNPEEGKVPLRLAIELAKKKKAPLVIATDPDADRLAVVELDGKGNTTIFRGDQLGILFADWMLQQWLDDHEAQRSVQLPTSAASASASASAASRGKRCSSYRLVLMKKSTPQTEVAPDATGFDDVECVEDAPSEGIEGYVAPAEENVAPMEESAAPAEGVPDAPAAEENAAPAEGAPDAPAAEEISVGQPLESEPPEDATTEVAAALADAEGAAYPYAEGGEYAPAEGAAYPYVDGGEYAPVEGVAQPEYAAAMVEENEEEGKEMPINGAGIDGGTSDEEEGTEFEEKAPVSLEGAELGAGEETLGSLLAWKRTKEETQAIAKLMRDCPNVVLPPVPRLGKDGRPIAMVTTAVSSMMLQKFCSVEGIACSTVLTGFKWLGNESSKLQKHGYNVLLTYEEAIGFCLGDIVKDKDGVVAAAVLVEMAKSLYGQKKTLSSHLESLYKKYGYFQSCNSYVINPDPLLTSTIFTRLRNGGRYWIAMGQYSIKNVRDLTAGFESGQPDQQPTLPVSAGSQMITYWLTNGCRFTLRTSGTEPRIKYYVEVGTESREKSRRGSAVAFRAAEIVRSVAELVLKLMLQPEVNHLQVPVQD